MNNSKTGNKNQIMIKKSTFTIFASIMLLSACNETSKEKSEEINIKNSEEKAESKPVSISGSWVQPNPINEKEVQGFTLNEDSSAVSINMATLLYKKWWENNGTLYLVAESIGNKVSSIDTTAYELVNHTDSILEIKTGNYTDKYKRQ